MAQSKTSSKILNSIFPFSDFLYILQQEEYSSRRLIKWLPRFFFRRNFQVRDRLKYTRRVRLTLFLSVLIWILSFLVCTLLLQSLLSSLILLIVWILLIPLFVLLGNTLSMPYFEFIKSRIRTRAVERISTFENLKIIVVTGSFGKTTIKNFVYQLVKYNYRTQMVPFNINTPAGIADWVNKSLNSNTEVLIAEVDSYEVGEIRRSCGILPADIAVLSNIGDQHLERFPSEEAHVEALSEVFMYSKPNAHLVTNAETEAKLGGFDKGNRVMDIVKIADSHIAGLSDSNQMNFQYAQTVARILEIPESFIEDTLSKLELPDRRQKLAQMYGYEAVDDSYNISFTTAQAGIEFAAAEASKADKKLLVVTAGIPELSTKNRDHNHELGKILSGRADHVVILGSIFADEIARGVGDDSKFTLVDNLNEFLEISTTKFDPEEWFLLVQPELNDLYY